jgi:hypothetical protein
MVLDATLTYLDSAERPIAIFALDSPTTIVGRAPLGAADLLQDEQLVRRESIYQVRRGDTHFVAIAENLAMSRQHFCIRRRVVPSGEAVYVLQDLNTCGGTWVNERQYTGAAMIQLKDGDRILCSARFLFSLPLCETTVSGTEG